MLKYLPSTDTIIIIFTDEKDIVNSLISMYTQTDMFLNIKYYQTYFLNFQYMYSHCPFLYLKNHL